jgi:transposase
MRRAQRSFSAEFKSDAVALVQQQGDTVGQACQAVGIGETALRRWLAHYEAEVTGHTSTGKAITSEQQRIQTSEAQVKRLEMEKAILKKTATLLAEDG